jgi:hypothetical protein
MRILARDCTDFFYIIRDNNLCQSVHPVAKKKYLYLWHMSEFHIGDAIKSFLKKSPHRNGIRAVQIEEIWETLMGKTIAKYTEKIQIINDKLFITTSVGPLKNELVYQKKQIIERVNEAFGEKVVSEVIIH